MSITNLLEDVLAGVAIGFAGRAAERLDPKITGSPTDQAARELGRQLADAMTADVDDSSAAMNGPPLAAGAGDAAGHPFTDREILEHRLAVWNHQFPLTPELLRAMQSYGTLCRLEYERTP